MGRCGQGKRERVLKQALGDRDHGIDVPAAKAAVMPINRVLDLGSGVVDPQRQGEATACLAEDHNRGATRDYPGLAQAAASVPRCFHSSADCDPDIRPAQLEALFTVRRNVPSGIAVTALDLVTPSAAALRVQPAGTAGSRQWRILRASATVYCSGPTHLFYLSRTRNLRIAPQA